MSMKVDERKIRKPSVTSPTNYAGAIDDSTNSADSVTAASLLTINN